MSFSSSLYLPFLLFSCFHSIKPLPSPFLQLTKHFTNLEKEICQPTNFILFRNVDIYDDGGFRIVKCSVGYKVKDDQRDCPRLLSSRSKLTHTHTRYVITRKYDKKECPWISLPFSPAFSILWYWFRKKFRRIQLYYLLLLLNMGKI